MKPTIQDTRNFLRMMVPTRIPIALLLILLPVVSTQAQGDLTDEPAKPRRFTVEMIIFRYTQEVSTGTEIFPAEKPAYDDAADKSSLLIEGEPLEEIEPAERIYRDVGLVPLSRDEYTMGDIIGHLRRLDVYDPLMHFGWTQSTFPDEETLPIDLGMLGRKPQNLSGTLRLYLSRYLHLVVDLQMEAQQRAAVSNRQMSSTQEVGDDRSVSNRGSLAGRHAFGQPPVRYRINENRILKSGELRYFDHPRFGALVKVTRVEEQPDEAPEAAETELLGYPAE